MGDSFHLIPRIILQITNNGEKLRKTLGREKLIASITMTIFYLLFFVLGEILLYGHLDSLWTNIIFTIAVIRVVICLYPQNRWDDRFSPFKWVLYRNVPLVLEGAIVTVLFFKIPGMKIISVLIVLSFLFYIPVAFFAEKNSKLGMLMIPKTLSYVFMLGIFLSL